MADKNGFFDLSKSTLSRRTALKGLAAGAGLTLAPGFVRYSQAQSVPSRAALSQLPLTVLMIAYTIFGLWLLATPTAG